ncbi:MAG: glycosyltransferase family 2 protein [Ignavibacteriae bacterium]|nr:glycosyltransferase family 2 protein [Ignavibacteriota bacterium]MCB9244038.1 glycosyltransferase family 2 protein [Ignavibacteriales bacterium]
MKLLGYVFTKNDEKVIGKCLERLSESCDGIIVVEDGSTDGTYDIVRSFPKVIKIFRNPPYEEWKTFRDLKKILKVVTDINPEWIIGVDSDDVLDKRFAEQRDKLLDNKEVGRYHFREITLWGDNKRYRVDKPEWYGRTRDRTPFLIRWGPNVKYFERHFLFPMNFIRWLRKRGFVGIIKRQLKYGTFSKKRNRLEKFLSEVFWPSDYMDYTNVQFIGYEGKEVEIPLVRLHYHFADMSYAWKKHLTYALLSATIQHRTPGEIPNLVSWASNKLEDENIKLEEVEPEWGAL